MIQKNNTNGITLIALVITIIVLLILASVTIAMLTGENGILNQARNAGKEYSKGEVREKVSLILSEYKTENSTKEKIEFDDFLRKNLQVGVAENDNDTYSFLLEKWQVVVNENKIISIEKFKLDVDETFTSVASMKEDKDLLEGELVQTDGYWSATSGGGAYYHIVSTTTSEVDGVRCILLDNGLYAELHVINDTVTVNQFGAYGDGEHDDSAAIQKALNMGYSNVVFESEKYKQESSIKMTTSDVFVLGNNAKIFNDSSYVCSGGHDWRIYICGKNNQYVDGVTIYNLNMESEKTADLGETQYGGRFVSNVTIEECKLTINEVDNYKEESFSNIWFVEAWDNMHVEHNTLINNANSGKGGNIFFSGSDVANCSNANIKNNFFEKKCKDEMMNFWKGNIRDVVVEGNTFKKNNDIGNSMIVRIGYSSGSISNVNMLNNIFDIEGFGSVVLVGGNGVDKVSDIKLNSNTIKYKMIDGGANWDIFSLSKDTKVIENVEASKNNITIETATENTKQNSYICKGDINFHDNTVDVHGNMFSLIRESSKISNNKINVYGDLIHVFYYGNCILNNNVYIKNNEININNTSEWSANSKTVLLLTVVTFENHYIELDNNSIIVENNSNVQRLVNFSQIKDSEEQKVYLYNNELGMFTQIRNYGNVVNHSVIYK